MEILLQMKSREFKLIIVLIVLCFISTKWVNAQDLRLLLTDEFKGRDLYLSYSEAGENKVGIYQTKLGRLKRDYTAPFLTGSSFAPGSSPEDVPSVGLAMEHWWLSFEILMKAQREYAACVGGINEQLRRRGQTCMIDQPCHTLYNTVMVIREYWVPSNVVGNVQYSDNITSPRKEDYIAHFQAGIQSVNLAVYHVGLCNQTLEQLRNQ